RYVVNGFAAKLTGAQAAQLRAVPGVVSVEKDVAMKPDTVSTPNMLKLTGPGGLWEQVGGQDRAGEDIVIGVVDTGIWPEHPSFSDRTGSNNNGVDGKLAYHQLPGWHGRCEPGEGFNASMCNQKLIGCRGYNATWLEFNALPMWDPEILSCRDSDSHGTHTASTAGGNANVEIVPGLTMSGMAPRARIAAYKICWEDGDPNTGGCYNGDAVAAIDQAVIDGVDVINYSIGGSTTSFLNVVSVAFFNAADAGVFVAASAGNAGTTSSVAHGGPWITTVAASTHDRAGAGQVILGGTTVPTRSGVNMAAGTGPAPLPLIHSSLAGVATDPLAKPENEPTPFAERVALCFPNHLDPSKVTGKIVVCDRGITARVEKGAVVKAAGGRGMILANRTAAENLVADVHALPAIHVNDAQVQNGPQTIRDYSKTPGATAIITDGSVVSLPNFTPAIASFSSRGPLLAGGGDLLKPDVTAPGVDVIAGTSPVGNAGSLFGSFQGTSMASPHIAGLAAVLKQKNPTWSPMMIKSALMTTASNLAGTFSPFNQGAGHVRPNLATDPGLVYESNSSQWIKFLCGTGQLTGASCANGNTMDPSDLNVASIAIGDMKMGQTIRRSVTNVGPAGTYTATVTPLEGMNIQVNPTTLTLGTGQTGHFDVTFTKTPQLGRVIRNAQGVITGSVLFLNAYQPGTIVWTDGTRNSRIPVTIRPQGVFVPTTLTGKIGEPLNANLTFGYDGPFAHSSVALTPATVLAQGTVQEDPNQSFVTATPDAGKGFTTHPVPTPSGRLHLRIAIVSTDDDPASPEADDLDLFLYRVTTTRAPNGTVTVTKSLLASAATSAALEKLNVLNPTAQPTTSTNPQTGVVTTTENVLYVHGFSTDGTDANYTLHMWAAGNSTALTELAPVTGGSSRTINIPTNVAPGSKYLGVIRWATFPIRPDSNGFQELARTVVDVD
ncbi:MAG TPA: S8 family peptidase, partial [Thermoanaerobaculia bacterium]